MTAEGLGLSTLSAQGLPSLCRRLEGPRGEGKEAPAKNTFLGCGVTAWRPPRLPSLPAPSLTLATGTQHLLKLCPAELGHLRSTVRMAREQMVWACKMSGLQQEVPGSFLCRSPVLSEFSAPLPVWGLFHPVTRPV
jgi:hypothetical protein